MYSRNTEGAGAKSLSFMAYSKGGMAKLVIGNIRSCIICLMLQTLGKYLAGQSFCDFFVLRCICVDNESSVLRKKLCKFAERAADIFNILEEIQMIRINIQDNADLREKAQKAVCILTGFGQEGL